MIDSPRVLGVFVEPLPPFTNSGVIQSQLGVSIIEVDPEHRFSSDNLRPPDRRLLKGLVKNPSGSADDG